MWGKRPKPYRRLSKRQTLGLLADLMAQAEEEQKQQGTGEPETALPYYQGAALPVPPPYRPGLRVADVAVDNSTGPDPDAGEPGPETQAPLQQDLPAQRQGDSSRHGSF
jgi:hypothetical protein